MKSSPPRIASIAVAVPPHHMTQEEAKDGARRVFSGLPEVERLLAVFDRSGVQTRYTAHPRDWYLTPRGFGERNDAYIAAALELGERAVLRALEPLGLRPADVDEFLFTTTTGLATPSVDALLAGRLGMRPEARRIPLFGLGCAGGAGGLAVASDRLRTRPEGVAVVLSVELCTLTLLLQDVTKVNLVGTALFGDGAGAAVLVGGERNEPGPAVLDAGTHRFPESGHLMGWSFSEEGFRLVLDPRVPAFIHEALPPVAAAFLDRNGLDLSGVRRFALHPGGRQVLAAYRRGLGLSREALEPSARALRDYGNLSSASVLFALNELQRDGGIEAGDHGLLAAMGPGFAAEMMLLRG